MKRMIFGCVLALAACDEASMNAGATGARSGGFQEFLVIGSRMTFEQCRARGGLIIRDNGSPMTACDPTVIGKVVPADEFDHPEGRAAQAAVN